MKELMSLRESYNVSANLKTIETMYGSRLPDSALPLLDSKELSSEIMSLPDAYITAQNIKTVEIMRRGSYLSSARFNIFMLKLLGIFTLVYIVLGITL